MWVLEVLNTQSLSGLLVVLKIMVNLEGKARKCSRGKNKIK